jgi:hypothetical protein
MGADVQLCALERLDGSERLAVTFALSGVELAVERRTLNGWRVVRRLLVLPEELEAVGRALERARDIARAAKRDPTLTSGGESQ